MKLVFPTEKELTEYFGFVTPEDRERWRREETPEQATQRKNFMSNLGRSLSDSGQGLAQEQRQAAGVGSNIRKTPRKTTRIITEHIREEEDLDAEYGY
ncbi:MAG TPA: hypothetical protein VFU07_05300 [Candidatus Lumbricidophila sp.]|nr:hypothetical protein [Candidatus Lumbricidophila sp.]